MKASRIALLFLVSLFGFSSLAARNPVGADCTYNGKKLYGKIQFVQNFADIKIKVVRNFPDLKVKFVDNFADRCGEWTVVENFPDLKVQIVENFPDIEVQYVENWPGLP